MSIDTVFPPTGIFQHGCFAFLFFGQHCPKQRHRRSKCFARLCCSSAKSAGIIADSLLLHQVPTARKFWKLVLDRTETDFCSRIPVGIRIYFEKDTEKKGTWMKKYARDWKMKIWKLFTTSIRLTFFSTVPKQKYDLTLCNFSYVLILWCFVNCRRFPSSRQRRSISGRAPSWAWMLIYVNLTQAGDRLVAQILEGPFSAV